VHAPIGRRDDRSARATTAPCIAALALLVGCARVGAAPPPASVETVADPDRDGVIGSSDRCASWPETVNGWEDADGCPDRVPRPDRDGDGVANADDACLDTGGPAANRGCPDPDRDADAVVDRLDVCPDEAGSHWHQGCRRSGRLALSGDRITVLDPIHFRNAGARILRRSHRVLDDIAGLLRAHPGIVVVRVEGHTDDRGDGDANRELSQRRAEAVVDYLVQHGISESRLQALGLGETRPIQPNSTDRGRAANRRVDFVIVQGGPGTDHRDRRRIGGRVK
jgi:outer membrane protein OmpA-like peptidoglycan-associated protein